MCYLVASDNAFSKAKYHDGLMAEAPANERPGDKEEGNHGVAIGDSSVAKEDGQEPTHVSMVRKFQFLLTLG